MCFKVKELSSFFLLSLFFIPNSLNVTGLVVNDFFIRERLLIIINKENLTIIDANSLEIVMRPFRFSCIIYLSLFVFFSILNKYQNKK